MSVEIFGIIYCLTNTVNGKPYVGQTRRPLKVRLAEHRRRKNSPISKAIHKYGWKKFTVEILEECSTEEELNEREIYWIAEKNSIVPNGYNLEGGGKNSPSTSEFTRARLSAANKGKVIPPEVRAKISAGNKGKVVPLEVRKKISAANKGRRPSEETRKKLSVAHKGKKLSPESIAKRTAKQKGRIVSDEERAQKSLNAKKYWAKVSKDYKSQRIEKMNAARKKKGVSAESRAKSAASHRGKKQSPEIKAKESAARKAYWATKSPEERARRCALMNEGRARKRALKKKGGINMKFSNAVVYQIYPKSFADSNGDGWGDIRGIISKLDYIASLGVKYVWMTPVFPSPMLDGGYDISDYCAIDPRFGTMEDFDELVKKANEKGLSLILDMVLCHTASEHKWFQRAIAGDENYQRYYILRDGRNKKSADDKGEPPTNWQCAFGGSAWEYVPSLNKWYLHLHDVSQPDLDWTNPKVREELANVVRFWKNRGVGGFRCDVINLISKPEVFEDDTKGLGRKLFADGPHVHEYLKELVKNAGIDGMITVGEMASTDIANCIKYSGADEHELSMTFSFHHLKVDYKGGDKWALMDADISALKKIFEDWQVAMAKANAWNALFWCNHDQPRAISRFGDDGEYWKQSAKMLAATVHLMRGTPYIYQGEEIGMTNAKYTSIEQYRDVESLNYYKILKEQGKSEEEAIKIIGERSRDNGRTPMQWSAEKYAGFSTAEPWIISPDNYKNINVEVEEKDSDSILNFYRMLVKFRKENEIVQEGDINFIERANNDVVAYRRTLGDDELIVLCNYRKAEISLQDKTLAEYSAAGYKKIIGNYNELADNLRPYEVVVFRK